MTGQQIQGCQAIDKHQDRLVFGTLLRVKEVVESFGVERVYGESVEGFGGQRDDTTAPDYSRRLATVIRDLYADDVTL